MSARPLLAATLALALLVVAGPARAVTPADCLSIPPSWESRVVYYQPFDVPTGEPVVNTAALALAAPPLAPMADGLRGGCGVVGKGMVYRLSGDALSPHRPLALSFWWCLTADGSADTGVGLCGLYGKAGYISLFSRGGPWCGLKRAAGVAQIYNLPDVQNVNGIYDTAFSDSVDLHAGVWHHEALVVEGGSLVTIYTDGKQVFQTRLVGRTLREDDAFRSLEIGGEGMRLDELMVLNRPLAASEIGDYVTAMRQMHAAGWPSHK